MMVEIKEISVVHGVSNACRNRELREGTRVSKLEGLEFNDGILTGDPILVGDNYSLNVAELIEDGEFEMVSTVVALQTGDHVGVDSVIYFEKGSKIYSTIEDIRRMAA